MSDNILGNNAQWVDGTTSPAVDTFVWVVQGKTPTTGTQQLSVIDTDTTKGVFLTERPSGATIMIHRENITHLEAAIALAKPLLGL